jgi:putative ABC transport system permease protein
LRTGITVAIIAFGIMALVGIITAIEAMNASLRSSFATMGAMLQHSIQGAANAFQFRCYRKKDKRKLKGKKSNMGKMITYQQARGLSQV